MGSRLMGRSRFQNASVYQIFLHPLQNENFTGIDSCHFFDAASPIIYGDSVDKEIVFKAGLDLECPVELDELQEAIEEVKTADKF